MIWNIWTSTVENNNNIVSTLAFSDVFTHYIETNKYRKIVNVYKITNLDF